MLNLFLALLLSSFSDLSASDEEGENNLQIAINRITRGINFVKACIIGLIRRMLGRKAKSNEGDGEDDSSKKENLMLNHMNAEADPKTNLQMMESSSTLTDGVSSIDFVTNAKVTVNIPIAKSESDLDIPNDYDYSSDDETGIIKKKVRPMIMQLLV